jgi:hypothetical protein
VLLILAPRNCATSAATGWCGQGIQGRHAEDAPKIEDSAEQGGRTIDAEVKDKWQS